MNKKKCAILLRGHSTLKEIRGVCTDYPVSWLNKST